MFWVAVLVFAAAVVWIIARVRRIIREKELAAEARAAELLAALAGNARPPGAAPAATVPSPSPAPAAAAPSAAAGNDLAQQKLLFESAHKAGEAGEPALAIQLYARLLARYPSSAFSDQARASAEAQKKKLVKA